MKNLINKLSLKIRKLNDIRKEYNKKEFNNRILIREKKESTKNTSQKMELEVSTKTLVKIILVFSLFLALKNIFIELQTIIIISGISFFMAMAIAPIVRKIEQHHIPRPLVILLIYIIFFGVLGILFVGIIPILAEQLLDIAYDLKEFIANDGTTKIIWLDKLLSKLQFNTVEIQEFLSDNLASISNNLQNIAGSTFTILSNVFQGVFNFIYALVLMFFILMEQEKIAVSALHLFPAKNRSYIKDKFESIQKKLTEWFHGQFILMVSVGLFTYLGMKILSITLGMKYAATLGLLAGIMELFPYIGVFITGILSVLIAINISFTLVISVIILIAITQFLEGNILVPVVLGRTVGLSAVVTLLALSIGGILGSAIGGVPLAILGMIFSIPVAASLSIFVEEYIHRKD